MSILCEKKTLLFHHNRSEDKTCCVTHKQNVHGNSEYMISDLLN